MMEAGAGLLVPVERHPTIGVDAGSSPMSARGGLAVCGTMTMRGVQGPLELHVEGPATPVNGDGDLRIRARGAVSRRAFGLDWDSAFAAGGLLIDDRAVLLLDVGCCPRFVMQAEALASSSAPAATLMASGVALPAPRRDSLIRHFYLVKGWDLPHAAGVSCLYHWAPGVRTQGCAMSAKRRWGLAMRKRGARHVTTAVLAAGAAPAGARRTAVLGVRELRS